MAYRTYINGHEWLGNNESSDIIFDELKRQGCVFDKNYCCFKGFQVKDLDGLVKATEKDIAQMVKQNKNIADFNDIFNNKDIINLTEHLFQLQKNAYIFRSVQLLNFIGKDNYKLKLKLVKSKKNKGSYFKIIYKLKKGAKCIFKAH